jgi:twitching motility protein PilI
MSKRRHKHPHKSGSHKPAREQVAVRPASTAAPDAMDMEDMSAALARAMEGVSEPPEAHPVEFADAVGDGSDGEACEVCEADDAVPGAHSDAVAAQQEADPHASAGSDPRIAIETPQEAFEAIPPEAAPETESGLVAEQPHVPHAVAFAKLADYERLSLEHVPGLPEQANAPGHWRGVGFGLGRRRLVTAFEEVVEIMPLPQITNVPGTQPWMLGVANVRGNLLPVVDLKQFLEGERTVIHEGQRVLVVRQSGGNVAVLIDALYGQRSFNDSQKVDAVEDESRYGYFIKQAYQVSENEWGVFSMAMLTRTPEFRQAAA